MLVTKFDTGINIPSGARILNFFAFLQVRGSITINKEDAALLDKVFTKMNRQDLKRVAMQLTASAESCLETYEYNSIEESKNLITVMTKPDMEIAMNHSNYGKYVESVSFAKVNVATVMSEIASSNGGTSIPMKYSDGSITVKLGDKYVARDEIAEICTVFRRNNNKPSVVEMPNMLEKFAKSQIENEDMRDMFLKSDLKKVDGVSLKDMGQLFKNGRLDGKCGEKKDPSLMPAVISEYLMSDSKEITAMHIDSAGFNRSGTTITGSSMFFKRGLDTEDLNVATHIKMAILQTLGIEKLPSDKDAKRIFKSMVERQEYEGAVLYNPSWLAKKYSAVKNNKEEAKKFAVRYQFLRTLLPVYLGGKGFKYVLLKSGFKTGVPLTLFMTIPNVVSKIIATYNMSKSVVSMLSLSEILKRFFARNINDTMKELVMASARYAVSTVEFSVPFVGVKDKKVGTWHLGDEEDFVAFKDSLKVDQDGEKYDFEEDVEWSKNYKEPLIDNIILENEGDNTVEDATTRSRKSFIEHALNEYGYFEHIDLNKITKADRPGVLVKKFLYDTFGDEGLLEPLIYSEFETCTASDIMEDMDNVKAMMLHWCKTIGFKMNINRRSLDVWLIENKGLELPVYQFEDEWN